MWGWQTALSEGRGPPRAPAEGLASLEGPPQARPGDALVEHEHAEPQVVEDGAHADGSDEGGDDGDRGPEPPAPRAPAHEGGGQGDDRADGHGSQPQERGLGGDRRGCVGHGLGGVRRVEVEADVGEGAGGELEEGGEGEGCEGVEGGAYQGRPTRGGPGVGCALGRLTCGSPCSHRG